MPAYELNQTEEQSSAKTTILLCEGQMEVSFNNKMALTW